MIQFNFRRKFALMFFSRILSLAYIDLELLMIQHFDQQIQKSYEEGKQLLFEYKNNQSYQIDLTKILSENLKDFQLRAYQLEGIKWTFFLFKYGLSGCLCDDMGLGKTIQSLCSISLIHLYNFNKLNNQSKNISLVVCPINLVYHWNQECSQYIKVKILSPFILTSKHFANKQKLSQIIEENSSPNLIITSYNIIIKYLEYFDVKFQVCLIDEAHLIKNQKTVTSINVKQIKSDVRLALTGTPIQNNVTELWSIFDYLMPAYLGTYEEFQQEFKSLMQLNLLSMDMSKMDLTQTQRQILDSLHRKVMPFIMRREKKDVLKDLPDKIIQDFECELTQVQKQIYDNIMSQSCMYFTQTKQTVEGQQQFGNSEEAKGSKSFLVVLNAIRKVLNHPSFCFNPSQKKVIVKINQNEFFEQENVQLGKRDEINLYKSLIKQSAKDQNYYYLSGKFQALKQIFNNLEFYEQDTLSCIQNKNKILIFTRSIQTLALISQYIENIFPGLKYLVLNNQQNGQQRHENVEQFNRNNNIKLLILTPKIGGLGLNLSAANIVIMFDHDFNPMNDLQAIDRAHRLGQKNVVNVFRLVCQDTIEEKIMGIQRFKLIVANTVINVDNASIQNIKESNFIEYLDNFAQKNAAESKREEEKNTMSGLIGSLLKDTNLEELWDEDEYEKEYI